MKKALIAAAVAGAFAAPSAMAAELSTNIYWSTACTGETQQPLLALTATMQDGQFLMVVVTDLCSHGLIRLITVLVLPLTCHLVT